MRTLTQVWVFFLVLIFLLLVTGFEVAGRLGLFISFLLSLYLVGATLRSGLQLFQKKLKSFPLKGHDQSNFLHEIEKNKLRFGFKNIHVHLSPEPSEPLIWKSADNEAFILLSEPLLNILNREQCSLLALLCLSHLEKRQLLLPSLLSVLLQSPLYYTGLPSLLSFALTHLFRVPQQVLEADQQFMTLSGKSTYDVGFFIHKLHKLDCNNGQSRRRGVECFSVLSQSSISVRAAGLPSLQKRTTQLIGFAL